MKYKLSIEKFIENPQYEEDLKEYKIQRERNYGYNQEPRMPFPEKFISTSVLDVELSEEEYKKVKQEVMKVFE